MIASPLHVERAQIQSQMLHKLEQLFSQSVNHHVILGGQFSGAAHETTKHRVNSTWRETRFN